jgi:hypothetical protein
MFRKLTFLALFGGAIAALIKLRGGSKSVTPTPEATSPEQTAQARPDQPEQRAQEPVAGAGDDDEAVMPDTSADDPTVREQEDAAAAEAAQIGGDPETVTAEQPAPEMRPVVEGAGDAPETFETTEEQGR